MFVDRLEKVVRDYLSTECNSFEDEEFTEILIHPKNEAEMLLELVKTYRYGDWIKTMYGRKIIIDTTFAEPNVVYLGNRNRDRLSYKKFLVVDEQ